MGTNCALLVSDIFLYCYESDFMDSLNHENQADVIELVQIPRLHFNIENPYLKGMVSINLST